MTDEVPVMGIEEQPLVIHNDNKGKINIHSFE